MRIEILRAFTSRNFFPLLIKRMVRILPLDKKLLGVVWIVCLCFAFVSSYFLSGSFTPQGDLDHSWSTVLEYAFEHHFQFGKDIVFTYGPLGFLNTKSSQGHLVIQRLAFATFWSAVVAWAVIGVARQIVSAPLRFVFLGWFLVFSYRGRLEQHAFLVMAYGCTVLAGDVRRNKGAAAVFLLLFGILALVKFSFFLAATASVLVCAVMQLCHRDAKASTLIVALFGATFVVLWLVAGQDLQNLWPWVRGSLEITSGYTQAMTILPKGSVFVASIAAGALFLAMLWLISRSRPLSMSTVGLLINVAFYVFLTWKLGFVRADRHVSYFLLSLPLLVGLLLIRPVQDSLPRKTRVAFVFLYVSVVVLCSVAVDLQEAGTMLTKLREWPRHMLSNAGLVLSSVTGDRLEAFPVSQLDQNKERGPDLPIARELIGNESVDVVNYMQWAALANGLAYRPRPVIQGYSAYTPYLEELNRGFFRSNRRPSYLLLKMQTIDGRFPTLDDATALLCILNTYRPVARDGSFLVLKASGTASDDVGLTLVHEQRLAFDEQLDLTPWNDAPVFMQVTVRPTLLGRAIKLLFQAPLLFLYTHHSEGKPTRYRFIPSMAERGFLLSPLLETNDDVIDLLMGEQGRHPDAIHFSRPAYTWGQMSDVINVRIYRTKHFPPDLLDQVRLGEIANLRNPVFDPCPSIIETAFSPERVDVEGEPALMVHAPSTVVVQIPWGAREFYGSMGILQAAYVGGCTDGVQFAIDVEDWRGKKRRLLTRLVQPREYVGDRGRLPFKITVDSQSEKRLILTAGIGPKNDGNSDWSFWSRCRFK
jgi:hypothetical protein